MIVSGTPPPADLIDAAWVLGGGAVDGDTGSGDYTDHVWVTGAGKGATITPVKGDTAKKLFVPNAGRRQTDGKPTAYGEYCQLWSATQNPNNDTNAWVFRFSAGDAPFGDITTAYTKLWAIPLRCVRS